jgi:hypothetical protein
VKYAYIAGQRDSYPVALMCRVLHVARTGLYAGSRGRVRGPRLMPGCGARFGHPCGCPRRYGRPQIHRERGPAAARGGAAGHARPGLSRAHPGCGGPYARTQPTEAPVRGRSGARPASDLGGRCHCLLDTAGPARGPSVSFKCRRTCVASR